METPPTGGGREGKCKGGGDSSEEPGDNPRLRPSPPAPRTLSCWAGAGAKLSGPVRPLGRANPATGYFCARRVRNPGLGRLRGRLGKLREGKSGRLGRGLARTPDPDPDPDPEPGPTPAARAAPAARGRGPARAQRMQPRLPPARRARTRTRTPPAALTHRRPAGTGVLGGPEGFGEGLPPPAGRAPAPSPRPRARPPVRPARPGMPWSEGRACRGRARPEGAAALTQGSGMRTARPARATSSRKAAGLRSPLCPPAGTPVAGVCERLGQGREGGSGGPAGGSLTADDSPAPQPLPDSRVSAGLVLEKGGGVQGAPLDLRKRNQEPPPKAHTGDTHPAPHEHSHFRTYTHTHTHMLTRSRAHTTLCTRSHSCSLIFTHIYSHTIVHFHAHSHVYTYAHNHNRTLPFVCLHTDAHLHSHPQQRQDQSSYALPRSLSPPKCLPSPGTGGPGWACSP